MLLRGSFQSVVGFVWAPQLKWKAVQFVQSRNIAKRRQHQMKENVMFCMLQRDEVRIAAASSELTVTGTPAAVGGAWEARGCMFSQSEARKAVSTFKGVRL